MANSNGVNIEVRTTGNDNNGGGIIAKTVGNRLVSDGSGNVGQASLSAGGFVAGDVGSSITIYGGPGWTLGKYTISSVNGVTGVATLNTSPGASLTNGSYYLCSGVDYSQQDAAQYTFTDLASTNANTATPSVTSASHSFVAADIGNLIQITAGTNFTTGFYQITGASGGAATLDRACGSVASVSGGTYAVGGALLTPARAQSACLTWSPPSNNILGAVAWFKAGTYTVTATIDLGLPAYVKWWGYTTVHGDSSTRPLITTATNSTILLKQNTISSPSVMLIDNINFSNTAVTPEQGIIPYNISNFNANAILSVKRSTWTGFTYAFSDVSGTNVLHFNTVFLNSVEIASCTQKGFSLSQGTAFLTGCYVHNCASDGVILNGGFGLFIADHSIFANNGGAGINSGSTGLQVNFCTFSGNTGDGIRQSNTSTTYVAWNNSIFYGNGGFGVNQSNPTQANIEGFHNAYGGNTTGDYSGEALNEIGCIHLTASPFVGGTNYALNNTAGAGALCRLAGYPTAFGASGTTTANDIGAVQTSGGGGGSTGGFSRAVMSGGMYS